ncbi:MAG: cytochrome c3 family protein, partial [Candidatus Margulisbacteria bacterium]|nr:cytochrome c3 family protein [Candidatus Margulisiibacteriota bacterium]
MRFKKFVFLVIILLLSRMVIAKGPHFGGGTSVGDPGYRLETTYGADKCKPCHIPHSAKGESRLWPVGVDSSGVTTIQNLCTYCHSQVKTVDLVDRDGDGFYDGLNDAHVLTRAHGQNGPRYSDTDTASIDISRRYGPGHLYRHSAEHAPHHDSNKGDTVQTRDGDSTIQGYGAISNYDTGFGSMAVSADSSSADQDFSRLSRLSCFSCHNPHADYVSSYINRSEDPNDLDSMNTYDFSQADNYILNLVGDVNYNTTYYESVGTYQKNLYIGRTRLVCLGCHYGGTEPDSTGFYDAPLSPTVIDGIIPPFPPGRNQSQGRMNVTAHYDGKSKCISCHPWDWPPANCTSCHGFPPVGASGSPPLDRHYPKDYNTTNFPAFSVKGIGAHETHVIGQGYDCVVCHRTFAGDLHNNDTVDVLFETAFVSIVETTATSTTYVTVDVKFPGGTRLLNSDTCEITGTGEGKSIRCLVACHNPIPGGGSFDKWVAWPSVPVGERGTPPLTPLNISFVWQDVYNAISCVDCHDGL